MEESALNKQKLIGRDAELATLRQHLADAIAGNGSTVLISGEPGIGKTALVEAFKEYAATQNVKILSGAASADSAQPFLVFSKALASEMDAPLFEEQEYTSFVKIFAINPAGMLVAEASSGEGDMDVDIFAGMLSAVQNFVGDSLGQGESAGLGRLEYGDMKILIEHGQHLFLTGVFSGGEHPDMKGALKRTLQRIEDEHGAALERWSGKVSEVEPIREAVSRLASIKFLVRRNLEGMKLESERIRIADEILGSLRYLSAERTLVVLLEDLHWADESSIFVMSYLARNVRKHMVLIMGTLRPGESDALQKSIESMISEESANEMAITKLDVRNTVSLINRAFSPNVFPDTLAERLYEQSKGNPLFVIEILKAMKEDGSIVEDNGKYALVSESYHIPATVEEVVNCRLDSLDPDAMAMVEFASCIGLRFDVSLAASNKVIKNADATLDKLLRSGILSIRERSVEFNHAVFQSVIYSGIEERWRIGHHRSIGEYLEISCADRLGDVIYDLARHFSRTKEYQKSSDYCSRAGEKAEGSYAVEQALEFYNDALESLTRLGTAHPNERISSILERMGDIHNILGNYEKALNKFLSAKEFSSDNEAIARLLRKSGSVQANMGEFDDSLRYMDDAKKALDGASQLELGRILVGEGTAYWRKGDYDEAMKLLKSALDIFENDGNVEVDYANALRMVGNIHLEKGEHDSALTHQERSLALADRVGYLFGTAAALNNIGLVYHDRGEFDRAQEFYSRSLNIAEKIRDRYGVAISLNNIGLVYLDKGDLEKAVEFQGRSLEIKEEIGDKSGVATSLNNIGSAHRDKGDLEKALEFYGRSLEIREKIGDKSGIAWSLYNTGKVHHDMGELGRALEFYGRSLEIRENIGDLQGVATSLTTIGDTHLLKGNLDLAFEKYEKSLEIFLDIGDRRLSTHPLCGLAGVGLEKKDIAAALGHAEKAMEIAVEIGVNREEAICRRTLGAVLREKGDFDKAAEEFNKAESILRDACEREEVAKSYYEHGLLFKAKDDPDKAYEYLVKALAEFERMGMKLWADKCSKVLEGI